MQPGRRPDAGSPLERWVVAAAMHPCKVLLALALLTGAAAWVSVSRFSINSNLSDLIDQNAPWRAPFDRYAAAFPERVDTLVLRISGEQRSAVESATQALVTALEAQPELFRSVSAPSVDPFFRDHALLYLSAASLEELIDRLASAQPLLAAVAREPGLGSFLERIAEGIEADETDSPDTDGVVNRTTVLGLGQVLTLLEASADALLDGADPTVNWRDALQPEEEPVVALITAQAAWVDAVAETERSNADVVRGARQLIAAQDLPKGVAVHLTGEIALAFEEIEAATTGVERAGWLSLLLLLLVLLAGVRSAKVILGIFLLLAVGVLWTTAFALLTVGSFNTLSLVFLVLFFGLGVDFALHFSLRYRQALSQAPQPVDAQQRPRQLGVTAASVGGAIVLCALTTAIAFLGFTPTPYRGLAELGIISAGGMVIAGFLTLTLLPAYFSLVGSLRMDSNPHRSDDALVFWLAARRRLVLILLAASTLVGAVVASQSTFDFSVLALRDERSESMQTLRALQADGIASDYALVLMSPTPSLPQPLAAALNELKTVASVRAPERYVPAKQEAKRLLLDDASDLFWDLFEPPLRKHEGQAQSARAGAEALREALASRGRASDAGFLEDLGDLVGGSDAQLAIWERAVLDTLLQELQWLQRALEAQPFTFEALPASLRQQLRSEAGDYLFEVLAARDLTDASALGDFVESVRALDPAATGRPVIEWGVGQLVIRSFSIAFALALVAVTLLLLWRYRSFWQPTLIMVPLLVALILTLAAGVLFDTPLNMANVLLLPLIFGLGVDQGIHTVDRYEREQGLAALTRSSTPQAVILSALTTIGAFASLMLSPHQGTASIGSLLSVALILLLVLTRYLLPVLLSGADDAGTGAVG